jgi:hypothetical protein
MFFRSRNRRAPFVDTEKTGARGLPPELMSRADRAGWAWHVTCCSTQGENLKSLTKLVENGAIQEVSGHTKLGPLGATHAKSARSEIVPRAPNNEWRWPARKVGKMKRKTIVGAALLLSACFAQRVAAQGPPHWRGGGGWGPGGAYGKIYDPKTVETVTGEVVSVDVLTPMHRMHRGVHVQLKTVKETISVHLGPAWYIENQDTKIEPKDKIEVKGSRVTFDGKPAIIAAEVVKGDEVLKLRDDQGIPCWAGWRKRGTGPECKACSLSP